MATRSALVTSWSRQYAAMKAARARGQRDYGRRDYGLRQGSGTGGCDGGVGGADWGLLGEPFEGMRIETHVALRCWRQLCRDTRKARWRMASGIVWAVGQSQLGCNFSPCAVFNLAP
jgi:hypothetical protein